MKLARVTGTVWATRKDERFESRRMLVVQPMRFDGTDAGAPIIALDAAESGVGDVVIYTTASEAAIPFRPGLTPTDATVVGVVDRVDDQRWNYVAGG